MAPECLAMTRDRNTPLSVYSWGHSR